MGASSPQAALATSPQFNHFAALSPEMIHQSLEDPEMNAILGLAPIPTSSTTSATPTPPSRPRGPLKTYTRRELLRLSGCPRMPPNSAPFEAWFGTPQKGTGGPGGHGHGGHARQHEDPAIASIASPSGRRTGGAGGFGEGFGFGGGIGIGGRGLGRGGTRNIGLRRQQQDSANIDPAIAEQGRGSFSGPMGKFAVRPGGERMRLGGEEMRHRDGDSKGGDRDRRRRDDGGDWRRGDRQQPGMHYHSNRNGEPGRRGGPPGFSGPRYDDDSVEPEWMADDTSTAGGAIEDPAIASASAGGDPSDSLVQFVPGEDMIAAHKRQMKARAAGGSGPGQTDNWRAPAEKPLVSFLGVQETTTATTTVVQPPTPAKPKEVNNASYFKKKGAIDGDVQPEPKSGAEDTSNAFQSRFQRFFAGAAPAGPGSVSPVPPPPGVVSHSAPSPQTQVSQPTQQQPRPSSIVRGPSEPQHQQTSPSPGPPRVDDHMAKLMGLLTTKAASPGPGRPQSAEMAQQRMHPSAPPNVPSFHGHGDFQAPPPGLSPYAQSPNEAPSDYMSARQHPPQMQRPDLSPERPDVPPHMMPRHAGPGHYSSPPPTGYPFGGPGGPAPPPPPPPGDYRGPRSPMGELPTHPRSFYDQRMGGPPPPPGGPDLLQLLQARGPAPPMGMLPPHPSMFAGPGGPGGPGPSPDDLLRNLQGGGPPPSNPGPPGYLPMGRGPPPPMSGPGPNGPGGGYGGPPPAMQGYLPPHAPQFYSGGGPPSAPPGMSPGGMMGPGPRGPNPGMMYGNPGASGGSHDMLAALLGPRTNGH